MKNSLEKSWINKVHQGDVLDLLSKIPDNSIDLIIADPPYNLSKGNNLKWKADSSLSGFGGDWEKVMENWDNLPLLEFLAFTIDWLKEARRVLKDTGSMWIFGTYHNIGIVNTALQMLEIEIINEVVWYKRNAFPNLQCRRLTASHETLLWAHGGKKRKYFFDYEASKSFFDEADQLKKEGKQMRTVWDIPNNKDKSELLFGKHPTQKPLKICSRIVQIASQPGDIVLSPFAGSGTECIAAKLLARNFIGIELESEYCELARERIEHAQKQSNLFT